MPELQECIFTKFSAQRLLKVMDTDDSQGAGCSADAKTTDKNEQQTTEAAAKVEESKFKSKYPTSTRPGGPLLFRKRLQKGQMYFDSGDYYMAKDKTRKAVLQVAPSIPTILQSPTGKIIPTVESVPSRNTSPVQSKLALEPSSGNRSVEEEHSPHRSTDSLDEEKGKEEDPVPVENL